jgi:hypothetical protein
MPKLMPQVFRNSRDMQWSMLRHTQDAPGSARGAYRIHVRLSHGETLQYNP